MKKIDNILKHNAKYSKLQKPLKAALVCDVADRLGNGRFKALSFKNGLLTVGVKNNYIASELQIESQKIIDSINKNLPADEVGISRKAVGKIRFRIK